MNEQKPVGINSRRERDTSDRRLSFSEIWVDPARFQKLANLPFLPDARFLRRIHPIFQLRQADDPRAALLALDPAIFGWIIGTDEMEMPALEAVTFTGENISSFALPLEDYPVGIVVEPIDENNQ